MPEHIIGDLMYNAQDTLHIIESLLLICFHYMTVMY